jgi:PAS domain S-box-containing protein
LQTLAKEPVMKRKAIPAAAEDLGAKRFINRFSIGRRLVLCFGGIFVLLLAVNGILLWQFHSAQVGADRRLTGVSLELIAALNLQSRLQSFNDRLDRVAQSQDAVLLRQESGSLRDMILGSVQDARNAITHLPAEVRLYPTFVPTIEVIESTLPSQLESLNSLAASGDWNALRLRLANEKQPLDAETSMLVKSITREVNDELGQTVTNIAHLERQMVIVLPLTALGTLLVASLLGVMITRSITTPLGKLMESSSALSRGEFDHLVPISGDDELARLGRVFNDTADKLRSLYETLQDSKAKLEEAQRIAHVGYWEWDLTSERVTWSDETYRIYGLKPQEYPIEIAVLRKMIHPEDLEFVFRVAEEAVRGGLRTDVEHRIIRSGGELRTVHSQGDVKKDASGRPYQMFGTVQDITDRKRAEEALEVLSRDLQESKTKLEEAQRITHVGYWEWDPLTDRVNWSDETYRIYGLRPQERPMDLATVAEKVHPEDWQQAMEQALGGASINVECRLFRPTGEVRIAQFQGDVKRDTSGQPTLRFGTVQDITDRKRAEQRLRESEAYLAEAQRLSQTGSWAWNPATGDIRYWSEMCFCLLGFDPAGPLPRFEEFLHRIHPDDQTVVRERFDKAIREKADFELDYRVVHPEKGIRDIHVVGHAVLDGSGNLDEFVGTVIDITERKRAEEALHKSQLYLSEGQRLAHMGSWAFNPSGVFDYWSQELFEIYGLDPQNGAPTLEQYLATVHPQDRDFMADTIKKMQAERTGCDVKKRIVRPDGEQRYIRCVGIPVVEGEVLKGFLGTAIDVTEQELLTQELRREQAYLTDSQSMAHIGGWAYNLVTHKLLHSSDANARLYGFDPSQGPIPTERFFDTILAEDEPRVTAALDNAARTGMDVYLHEYRIRHTDGSIRFLRAIGHRNPSGEPGEYVGVTMDITELKSAEQEREKLRQLEAELAHIDRVSTLGEMAASLAHEIKQPIAAAITSANSCIEWLAHDPPNLDRARAAAARIDRYGNRAAEIIDRIRSLYRKSPPQRELVDVNGIIHEMLTLLNGEATRYSVAMGTELAAELPKITADRVQLQQVFMNLMLNAIEAMRDSGGELTVNSELQDGQLQFSVSDTGVGLPTENTDQIFSAFFTTKPQGSGMGLAISRSIVESHGGRLWACANSGGGATFHFTLPIQVTESSPSVA